MKKIILNIMIFLLCIHIHGQRRCGSDLNLTKLQQTDPARYQRVMDLENRIQEFLNATTLRSTQQQSTIYIPVVVHIVFGNTSQNISDAQVHSQIEVLNEDFRRLNVDRKNTPNTFANVAGDANIQFVLAKKDPYGNSTTGIRRRFSNKNKFYQNNEDVKFSSSGGENGWNPQRYLNIWVCDIWKINDDGSEEELAGYAQFPSELITSPNTDGVVINYKYFGRNGSAVSPYNKGRTATHEIGHWLNLVHIWGDEDNCTATDFVDDTPNQYSRTTGCPSFPKTDACSLLPGIMFMNFMDYSDDACMNLFTNGQIERMQAVLWRERWIMSAYSNCYNGIQDYDKYETGIDCGGNCPPCGATAKNTCFNGIKDSKETGVDCGEKCLPCELGDKVATIISVADCECGDAYTPVNNNITPPSLFSGQNLLYKRNIVNVSHGNMTFLKSVGRETSINHRNTIKICGEYRANGGSKDAISYESILKGGTFFEEDGVQFCPDKMYKLKFNYWYNYGTCINFSLTDGLVNSANCVLKEEFWVYECSYFRYYEIYQTPTSNLPQVTKRYNIGNVLAVNPPMTCHDNYDGDVTSVWNSPRRPYFADYRYTEVTLLFKPDNYYKQLWVNGNEVFFNSLTIEEFCIPDIEYNSTTANMPDTIKASNTITFQNINYEPANAVELIAGNAIIIKDSVRIAPQNQGSVHMRIDENVCLNNTLRSVNIDENSSTETLAITPIDEIKTVQFDGIKLYPNPTTGIVTIIVPNDEVSQIKTISLYDASGRMLKNSIDFMENILDLSNLKDGIYFLKIQMLSGQTTHKVTIKK